MSQDLYFKVDCHHEIKSQYRSPLAPPPNTLSVSLSVSLSLVNTYYISCSLLFLAVLFKGPLLFFTNQAHSVASMHMNIPIYRETVVEDSSYTLPLITTR